MSSEAERKLIREKLIPELLQDFDAWGKEYQQPRDLGARGEFANLYRKVRKLKTIIWDGVDSSDWRESTRTIVKEVVAHGLLLLCDLESARTSDPTIPVHSCSDLCTTRSHTFRGDCLYRRGPWKKATDDAS